MKDIFQTDTQTSSCIIGWDYKTYSSALANWFSLSATSSLRLDNCLWNAVRGGGVLDWKTVSGMLLGGRLRRLLEGKGPGKGKGKRKIKWVL